MADTSLIHTTIDGIKIMQTGSWGDDRDKDGVPRRHRRVFVEVFDDERASGTGTTKEDEKSCSAFANGMARYYKECKKRGLETPK